jgi:DASS family divalent anion:Na+ symporter
MGWVFVLLIVLWSTKALHGLHTTLVAWIGVCVLLLTNTEKWSDMVANSKAWDTLIWLGGLLTMANMLKAYGFIAWFADNIGGMIQGIDGMTVAIVLALVYFYSMYMFSMLTAHIAAMVAAFFALSLGAGAPVMVSVALLAYFSNLCACTTYYSTGPVVIYFGLGYVESKKWFAIGFLVSLFHMAIWLGLGSLWWKIIGWW